MNKKGFTLIELLAVIVILAVIALIATPAVLNIIEDSKESAAKDSAMTIAKAAETYYVSNATLQGEEVGTIDLTEEILEYKGEKPEKGYVTYDEKGNAYLKMYMNGYCVISDYDNTVVSEKMDSEDCDVTTEATYREYVDGEVVYFNPITNSACLDTDYVETTNSRVGFRGTSTNGCMKWYAFLDTAEAETVKLLSDHNTSTSETYWKQVMTEINNVKDNNLYGWHEEVRSTARLISAYEVNEIAPWAEGTWTDASSHYFLSTGSLNIYRGAAGTNEYAWLFDNTMGCEEYGCHKSDSAAGGYYTSTKHGNSLDSDTNPDAWHIYFDGSLWHSASYQGVRPVIEVPKTKFTNQ